MFVNLREVNPEVVTANRNNRTTTNWVWHDNNNNRLLRQRRNQLRSERSGFRSITGVTDAVPNPNEVQPKSDEWSLTFEREIKGRWGVRSTAVYARNYDLRRTEEIYRPYSAYNIAITNPDPGRRRASRDQRRSRARSRLLWEYPLALSGRQFAGTTLVDWPGNQVYKTFEVAGTRRLAGGWQMNASMSFTRADADSPIVRL